MTYARQIWIKWLGTLGFMALAISSVSIQEFSLAYVCLFFGLVFIIGFSLQSNQQWKRRIILLNVLLTSAFLLGFGLVLFFQIQSDEELTSIRGLLQTIDLPSASDLANSILEAILDLIGFDRDTTFY